MAKNKAMGLTRVTSSPQKRVGKVRKKASGPTPFAPHPGSLHAASLQNMRKK
jgi:hypothetical protein